MSDRDEAVKKMLAHSQYLHEDLDHDPAYRRAIRPLKFVMLVIIAVILTIGFTAV